MKIAIAHYSTAGDISGVTSWLLDFCTRLDLAGHKLYVLLIHLGSDPNEASILPLLLSRGISVDIVPRAGSLQGDIHQTLAFLNRYKPEVFLPQCVHAHFLAAARAGLQGLPWVFTMHSDDPDYWCVLDVLDPSRCGGAVVCVSQHLASALQQRYPALHPEVIPYGVISPEHSTSYSSDPFRVVFSGRVVELQKNINGVLDALILACHMSPRIEAVVLGNGPALTSCVERVWKAGLAGRIQFSGTLSVAEVQSQLLTSQAILLLSDYEGLPLALLEAMAAGVVPVVRYIQSGIPELVQHGKTGLLVDNDPINAATELVRLSEDRNLFDVCSSQARRLIIQHYSASSSFDRWSQLLTTFRPEHPIRYPVKTRGLDRQIPMKDQRFTKHYPPSLPQRLNMKLKHLASYSPW